MYKKDIRKSKIALLKGENGRRLIEKNLKEKKINISIIECYKKIFRPINNNLEIRKWRSYKINTLVITSGEVLKKLNEIINISSKYKWLLKCKIFIVGNRLYSIAKKIGWKNITISNSANNENLFKIIKKYN